MSSDKMFLYSLVASTVVFLPFNSLAQSSFTQNALPTESTLSDLELEFSSQRILLTSESGKKFQQQPNVTFKPGLASGIKITIDSKKIKQKIVGIGSSFTESSAFVLAHLAPKQRDQVMRNIYAESGANFSLARTTIGSTDFAVHGKYSYAEVEGDQSLKHFSISPDNDGFKKTQYPGINDESFDLLPMIKQAQSIKEQQQDDSLKIIASAWTAPPWMKDINTWFIKPTPKNSYQGTGGKLLPQYHATYAHYLTKYLQAYQNEGVKIWGLTPVNEPNGNSGQWESMHFTPETQNKFIKQHLGPTLVKQGHEKVNLLIYDQNRDHLEEWADAILADKETAPYVYGVAVHWYASSYKVYEEALRNVNNKYPQFPIIHTEGTIDDLGKPAPGGISDPEGFQESNWFNNDAFWWNKNATDWAYTASWAPNAEDHPIYSPVHRYARNIIVSLNNWMAGWVDWNVVLDHQGGPNHAGNFCGAPIMIDVNKGDIYYTPIYDVLKQFSRTIRPGDQAVQTSIQRQQLDADAIHASATINSKNLLSVQILNTTKHPIQYQMQIDNHMAGISIEANAIQTVQVVLPH